MQRIILFVICLLMSALGAVGCHTTPDNGDQSTEIDIEQSQISDQSEENSEIISEESLEILTSEEESKLVDYSSGGGIVLPDDEW